MAEPSYDGEQWYGVVHTASFYALQNIDLTLLRNVAKNDLQAEIKTLQEKELSLYRKFKFQGSPANSFNEFKQSLKSFFTSDVVAALDNFSANSLQQSLDQFAMAYSDIYNQNIKIIFHLENFEKIGVAFKENFQTEGPHLTMKYNNEQVKKLLNDAFVRKGKFNPESTSLKAMNTLIKNLINQRAMSIQVEETPDSGDYVEYIPTTIPNFPWGVTVDDIKAATEAGNDSALYQELDKALARIKVFVTQELTNHVPAIEKAALTVWDHHYNMPQYSGHNMLRLFQGTRYSNFKSAVQGTLGEFGAAVIFQYLNDQIQDQTYAELLGNTIINGQKPKTDVQIFSSIGLQVKNYVVNADYMRDISTTISPEKFMFLAAPGDEKAAITFYDFLVNYYFNLSYQATSTAQTGMMQIKDYLRNHLGALMNMAVADSVDDVVTFYLIDNQYLLPGSVILIAAQQIQLDVEDPHSSYLGYTDLGYAAAQRDDNKDLQYTKHGALAYTYWERPRDSSWQPTQENQLVYNSILSNISLRTTFNPLTLLKQYALYEVE